MGESTCAESLVELQGISLPTFEKVARFCRPDIAFNEEIDVAKMCASCIRDGQIGPLVMILTEEVQKRQAAEELAMIDPLTGLLNRRGLHESLGRSKSIVQRWLWAELKTQDIPADYSCGHVMMLDADYFKEYNDQHGHSRGDIFLQSWADSLAEAVRGTDVLGRFGGEEVVAFIFETDGGEISVPQQVFERTRVNLARNLTKLSVPLTTFSAGVVPLTWRGLCRLADCSFEEFNNVLGEAAEPADQKLYQAKQEGRNRMVEL